ncbi:YacL family protein [Ferrimonas pelagia]|uniref:YacL family protein n=1 Tax=Ferrimonas pelagia TaxID=1177826 RepID=A0ABP9EVA1_9GAMM
MEFEFRRELGGSPVALMSMGHEAIGRFLQDELQQPATIALVQTAVAQRLAGERTPYRLEGSEQTLLIEADEISVQDHSVHRQAEEDEFDPALAVYDAESEAVCGLEDFDHLLESWLAFIRGR